MIDKTDLTAQIAVHLEQIVDRINVTLKHMEECSTTLYGGEEPDASGDFETAVACPHGFSIRIVEGGDYPCNEPSCRSCS